MTTDAPDLWAVHAQGPDEYIAAASQKDADEIKAQLDVFDEANAHREHYPRSSAVVVRWPWDAAAHAEALESEEARGA